MRLFLLSLCFLVVGFTAHAQNVQKMSDAEQLGMMAGLATACGAEKKLEDFELISARLLANDSPTEESEKQKVWQYMRAKWDAMQRQKQEAPVPCNEILESFNKLPIFNSIVYKDGSVKLPDGSWSKPLRPMK